MRLVIQRVKTANVQIEGKIVGEIQQGLLVLIGIELNDTEEDVEWLVNKLVLMRIFSDDQGKMNQSVLDVNGELLLVSQFTLHASTLKGNRPSFISAARPEQAIPLYEKFIQLSNERLEKPVQTGVFGADMLVTLAKEGPVTIMIDAKNRE